MHRLLLLGFVWLLSCLSLSAEVLTNGLSMTAAIRAMRNAGYTETGLDMMPKQGTGVDLRFWGVGEGVLIVTYSKSSQKITEMAFWFADERPKATRQTFEFDVTSFDAGTGVMTLRTRKGEPGGAANGSQPIRSETNRTSSAAGSRR